MYPLVRLSKDSPTSTHEPLRRRRPSELSFTGDTVPLFLIPVILGVKTDLWGIYSPETISPNLRNAGTVLLIIMGIGYSWISVTVTVNVEYTRTCS